MKKINYSILIIFFAFIVLLANTSFGQNNISAEKMALIQEINKLTGIQNLKAVVETKSTNISFEYFESLIEKDSELTNSQKEEANEFLDELKLRLNNQMADFFSDEEKFSSIYSEVVNNLYDQNFTEGELKDLVAFYRTSTGKKSFKFVAKFDENVGKLLGDAVGKNLNNYISPKIDAGIEELKKKIQNIKKREKLSLITR